MYDSNFKIKSKKVLKDIFQDKTTFTFKNLAIIFIFIYASVN